MASTQPILRESRPTKRQVAIVILVVVGLIIAVTGSYVVWRVYQPQETKRAETPPAPTNMERNQFLRESTNYEISEDASSEERVNALRFQGMNAYEVKDYGTAVQRFEEILATPKYDSQTDILYSLAQSYEQLGDNAKAKAAYQKLIAVYRDMGVKGQDIYQPLEAKVNQL